MKTIYLQISIYQWQQYEFQTTEDIRKIMTKIGDFAKIGDCAEIDNDYKLEFGNPLYIIGSKHCVVNYVNDKIQIGCKIESFSWWIEHYEGIGKKERYSEKQILEYKSYIDFIINKYKSL